MLSQDAERFLALSGFHFMNHQHFYFGAGFHMPLGVALLLAAIGGALLVGIVGTARIVQLRRSVRRRQ